MHLPFTEIASRDAHPRGGWKSRELSPLPFAGVRACPELRQLQLCWRHHVPCEHSGHIVDQAPEQCCQLSEPNEQHNSTVARLPSWQMSTTAGRSIGVDCNCMMLDKPNVKALTPDLLVSGNGAAEQAHAVLLLLQACCQRRKRLAAPLVSDGATRRWPTRQPDLCIAQT